MFAAYIIGGPSDFDCRRRDCRQDRPWERPQGKPLANRWKQAVPSSR